MSIDIEHPDIRRMPEKFHRHLLRVQGGKLYLPAAYRIVWFRDEFPIETGWCIRTRIVEGGQEAGFATVQAEIVDPDGRVICSGHKTETRADFPAGWVEKAETGAVARALALAGFGTQFSPDLEEGSFADSPLGGDGAASPPTRREGPGIPAGRDVWPGPGACPECNAPAGKRHGSACRARS